MGGGNMLCENLLPNMGRQSMSVCKFYLHSYCKKLSLNLIWYSMLSRIIPHCIRAPPRRGRYWKIPPRRPRDFLRPERFPEGGARGKSWGSREISRAEGMDFPIPLESWWSTDILSSSNFLQGVDQQILPCGQGRIDSVKFNPSLLMMRECKVCPTKAGLICRIY